MGNKNGERWWEAELYRLKGELLLAQEGHKGKTEEVEQCFLKAIAVARHQQAKSLELRAIMSLVRLRQHQAEDHAPRNTQHVLHDSYRAARHKLNEAHKLLSEVYNWFTEGLDTKDLQDAKTLLDELAERG